MAERSRRGFWYARCILLLVGTLLAGGVARAEPAGFFFISEFQVQGVHDVSVMDIEKTVYPFLGPNRRVVDIRAACSALEKLYSDHGFKTASVSPVEEKPNHGVVTLAVREGKVGKLRVKGAKYYAPSKIKAAAPSMAEGKVINFDDLTRDVVALNQQPDRTVTPKLNPGTEPGTYDVELDVKDSAPLHGSAEVNNYNSPNTKPLRVKATVSDDNLWQSGQTVSLSFEEAPERRTDSEVFSGYYMRHLGPSGGVTLMVDGTKQDSNISTLGGATVAGPGEILGVKAIVALPPGKDWSTGSDRADFSQTATFGVDYKHFKTSIDLGATATANSDSTGKIITPITYLPFTIGYSALWNNSGGKGSTTDFDASTVFHFRGVGSGPNQFNLNRSGADGGFIVFKADASHTQEMPNGFELFVKAEGQVANQPLVSSEEFSGGGEATVRGYLESEAVGDHGLFGTVEIRTPSLPIAARLHGDWRFFVFGDDGFVKVMEPLSEQKDTFTLASVGVGTRLTLLDHIDGGCEAAFPLQDQTYTKAHDLKIRFHLGVNY